MATYMGFEKKAKAVTFADLRAHGLYELAAACDASAPETLEAWERTAKEQNRAVVFPEANFFTQLLKQIKSS